jgi:hypothetical protein
MIIFTRLEIQPFQNTGRPVPLHRAKRCSSRSLNSLKSSAYGFKNGQTINKVSKVQINTDSFVFDGRELGGNGVKDKRVVAEVILKS